MVGDPGSRPKDRRVQIKVPPRGSPSVARAVAILNLLAQRPGGWSLTQIASALGLAKSSTLAIIASLEANGLVSRADNSYELDIGVLTPAGGFLRGGRHRHPVSRQFGSSGLLSGEIGHLASRAGDEVIFLARYLGRQQLPVTAGVGDRFPASITAVGTALLAELTDEQIIELYRDADFPRWTTDSTGDIDRLLAKAADTRRLGYAVDRGETHPNVLGFALVVHRAGDHVQDLAVGCSMRLDQTCPERQESAVAELHRIRAALENGNELR